MLAVGLGIVFGGYTVTWYGFSLLKRRGLTFLDLVVPGYYAQHPATGLTPAQQADLAAGGTGGLTAGGQPIVSQNGRLYTHVTPTGGGQPIN